MNAFEKIIKDSGLKKGFIAKEAGIHRSNFTDLLKYRRKLTALEARKIALILKISTDQLIETVLSDMQ